MLLSKENDYEIFIFIKIRELMFMKEEHCSVNKSLKPQFLFASTDLSVRIIKVL